MYLYLYIHFDTISRTTLNSTLCLAQTGTRTKVTLVMREREREQCESSKLGRSLSCDKKRNFTTLCWNFAYVTYHHIAELLPFKPAKILTKLHQFWQKRQETTQCNNHHNGAYHYPPHTYIPKTKTFHLVVTCFTQILFYSCLSCTLSVVGQSQSWLQRDSPQGILLNQPSLTQC